MDLQELKKIQIKEELNITEDYGKIMSFVDFGNINYWFESDRQTQDFVLLKDNEKLVIDISGLKSFLDIFSSDSRFYYGHNPQSSGSIKFIQKLEEVFGKKRVFTKALQNVRHYLEKEGEKDSNTRTLRHDKGGDYVFIPKCNFDVEISVDAIKTMEYYDTICLLSGDADFVHLLRFLKQKGKKVIIIKGGHIVNDLKKISNTVINAQSIKKHITTIKQKPSIKLGFADRNPESTGRTNQ